MANQRVLLRTSTGWQDLAVQGARGIQGIQGIQGVQGPTGPTGPANVIPRVTSLPGSSTDGQEVYWQVDAGPPAVVWHMRRNAALSKWEFLGGPPIAYRQEGENNAYTAFTNGTNMAVNAAMTKLLAWNFTPPIDCWADIDFSFGIVQKTDAAYNWVAFSVVAPTAPPIGTPQQVYRTQHTSVQQFEPYYLHQRFGLTAGVAYSIYVQATTSGGTWTVNQAPNLLSMTGSAWPR